MALNLLILASSDFIYLRFIAIPVIMIIYWIYTYFQKQNKQNKIEEEIKQFKRSISSNSIEIQKDSTISVEEIVTERPNKLLEEFIFKNLYFSKKYVPQTIMLSFVLLLIIIIFMKSQTNDIFGVIFFTFIAFLILSFTIFIFFEKKMTNLFYLTNDLKVKIWSSKIEVYNLNEKLVFEINSNQVWGVKFHPAYGYNGYGQKSIAGHLISINNSVGLINNKINVDVVNSEYVQKFYIVELLTFSENAKGEIYKLKFKEVVLEFVRLNNLKITNNY